jgi:hypothetical protein
MSKKQRPKPQEPIEDLILRQFEENFQRLKFENGHSLAPELKEAAKRQALLYWRRLKDVAEAITDTEVRLNLPGQKTPKKRKFSIEGVVDIVREKGRTIMYDLKTHDSEYVKKNLGEYERQLNVYAYIWRNLRGQDLEETAIIATMIPDALNTAWENRQRNPDTFEQALQHWNPVIPIPFDTQHVEKTVEEFARVVDAIEDGEYSPPPVRRLKEEEVHGQTFATRVCRNCDVRFSCSAYREYANTSKAHGDSYENGGDEADRENRMNSVLETL